MVVDDDASVRDLIVRALSPKYNVITANDGLAASEMLGGVAVPDLLVCDVMMPKIDGFTLVKMIRQRDELSRMAVIFLTAKATPANVVQGIQLGAKHYIQKPFSVVELLDKVNKLLK